MANLIDVIGQQGAGNIDIPNSLGAGLKTGIQLATAQNQVEQSKLQLEQQKEELSTARFNKVNNMLDKISKASPEARTRIATAYRGQLNQMGIPMSDATFEDLSKNPDVSMQISALNRGGFLSQLGKDPGSREQVFTALANELGIADATKTMYTMNQQAQQTAHQNEQDRIANKRADNMLAVEQAKEAKANEKLDRADVAKLSERLGKDSVPEVVSAVKSINKSVGDIYAPAAAKKLDRISGMNGFAAAFKIPFTDVMPFENTSLKGEDLHLYQDVASLRNAYLKLRSGGAVSDTEGMRFLQELGSGGIRTGEQLQNGIQKLTEAIHEGVKNIEGGYNANVKDIYKRQGGGISSDMLPTKGAVPPKPAFDANAFMSSAAGLKKPDGTPYTPEEVAAFLAKKGVQ